MNLLSRASSALTSFSRSLRSTVPAAESAPAVAKAFGTFNPAADAPPGERGDRVPSDIAMERLYRQRFVAHAPTLEAVRAASLGLLRDARARGASTHPARWAGFIAAGDWR